MSWVKSDLETILETYPEKVGESLKLWRKAEFNRKKVWALVFLQAKGRGMSVAEAEATADTDAQYETMKMTEIEAEGQYRAFEETLLATKKLCDHRTAF